MLISDVSVLMWINSSPYDKGWIIKVKVSDSGELNNLMDADKYTKFCEEEDASKSLSDWPRRTLGTFHVGVVRG